MAAEAAEGPVARPMEDGTRRADELVSETERAERAMARIAQTFPDAASLARHQQIQAKIQLEILDLKDEIAKLKLELRRDQDPSKMGRIQDQIGQLMLQINVIREKAAEAEAIVKNITTDVQRLDIAKRNLTGAIQTLERWGMLKQAHAQLKELLPTRRFREMSQALAVRRGKHAYRYSSQLTCQAVLQLLGPLKPLSSIPEVAEVFKAAEQDRRTIQEKVSNEMDTFFRQDPNRPPNLRVVQDVCLTIDVLGGDFRNHIIERYLQLQLAEYRRIFRSTDEAGQLDNVPRRYAWFRRVLKHHDEEESELFPASWEMTRLLVSSFAEYTRADLANVLGKQTPQVGVLFDALQATKDFESSLERRFDMPQVVQSTGILASASSGGKTISSIFDNYFGVYVDAQDRAIADMLSAHRGPRSRSSIEGMAMQYDSAEAPAPTVLPSSTELFYFYGQTLEQCGKYTTGEPMQRLAGVFAKWLKVFSDDVLLAALRSTNPPSRRSAEGRANMQEIRTACMILNTAEYCQTISLQLEERLKDKVDEEYTDKITFQDERETFTSVISVSITSLLRELESSCEPAFAAILRSPWSHLENVSGRSAYIVDLVGSIKQVAEVVRASIESRKYVRNFADKAVGVVITRFTQAVVRSRPLKKIGAEQILLDVQAVKACLLDLPEPHPESGSNAYTKYVTKNTGQLETMLKVILAPDDPPEGFVQNYCLLIGDRSFTNFQKVLDLKGTARADQQKLLDIFLSVTSTKDDLADTSFLTSLDMDPAVAPGGGAGAGSASAASMLMSPTGSSGPGSAGGASTGTNPLFSPILTQGSSGLPALLRGASQIDFGSGSGDSRSDTPKAFGDFRRLVSFATRRD